MAAGMFTKQATFLTARFLNDVNDSVLQGAVNTVPSGVQTPAWVQDIPGDRICLDDATALALSDTAVGTLYGGLYEYVLSKSGSTAAPALGIAAFFLAADIGATTGLNYEVTPDAQPSAAVPAYIQGVYISAPTKGNYCWIQIAGIASCTFDSSVAATTAGSPVTTKISPSNAATFDNTLSATIATTVVQIGLLFGVSVGTVTAGSASKVAITRFPARL